jgi:hypothetical protein
MSPALIVILTLLGGSAVIMALTVLVDWLTRPPQPEETLPLWSVGDDE